MKQSSYQLVCILVFLEHGGGFCRQVGGLYPGDVDAAGGARPRRICQGEGGGTIRPLGWSFRDFVGISGTFGATFETKNLWLVIQSTCKSGCSKVGFMWCYYDFLDVFFFWGWLIETLQKTGKSMSQCYFWSFSGSKPRIFHRFFRERSTKQTQLIPSDSQVFDCGSFVCCRCASWSWLYWGSCSSTWHFDWRMLKIWETFDVILSDS